MITEPLEPTVRVSSASSSVCVLRTGVRADVDLFLYRRLRADTGRLAVGGALILPGAFAPALAALAVTAPRRGPLGSDRAPS